MTASNSGTRTSLIKQAVSVVTALALLWCQTVFSWASIATTQGTTGAFSERRVNYQFGSAVSSMEIQTGVKTVFVGNKIDYTFYIGINNSQIKLTDYDYDSLGRITRITDLTTGKYILYGETNGNGWGALTEHATMNGVDVVIGEYNYDDEGHLVSKNVYDLVDTDGEGGAEGQRTLTGRIVYDEQGNPAQQYAFWMKIDDDLKSDTPDVWVQASTIASNSGVALENGGILTQSWTYDSAGRLTSSVSRKLNVEDRSSGGTKNVVWEMYDETTIYENGKAKEIRRDGERVGTFVYVDGLLSQTVYQDVRGLTTTTHFDALERESYAETRGQMRQIVDLGGELKGQRYQAIYVNIDSTTHWTYNDTGQPLEQNITITDEDGTTRTETLVCNPGSLVSKRTVSHATGDYDFNLKVKKFGLSVKVNVKGHIDSTTDSTEFYQNGEYRGSHSEIKDNGWTKTKITNGLGIFLTATLLAFVLVAALCAIPAVASFMNVSWEVLGKALVKIAVLAMETGAEMVVSLTDKINRDWTGENTAMADWETSSNHQFNSISMRPPTLAPVNNSFLQNYNNPNIAADF